MQVPAASFARGGAAARLAAPFRIAAGIASTAHAMYRDRPALVAGFGGYPSLPALAAAGLLKIPRMIHEQNGVLGRVNRHFAPGSTGSPAGLAHKPAPGGTNAEHTGNPVRAAILRPGRRALHPAGRLSDEPSGLRRQPGRAALSDRVPAAVAQLPEAIRMRLRVAQQARPEDIERVEAAYAAASVSGRGRPVLRRHARRLAEAQLVIARAGASSWPISAAIGRPSILIPYAAAIRDHQSANAAPSMPGAPRLMPEAALIPRTLARHPRRSWAMPDLRASAMAAGGAGAAAPMPAPRSRSGRGPGQPEGVPHERRRHQTAHELGPIHFVGIGGIGMSGIAEVLLNHGYRVQGSDLKAVEDHRAAGGPGRAHLHRPARRTWRRPRSW
jgi:UDP-N-acetylglucosamine--N-acetylmuramyl-(pentapeptide) pyrophosphoryl-undecaprenol N-acetylglucosamine transferase